MMLLAAVAFTAFNGCDVEQKLHLFLLLLHTIIESIITTMPQQPCNVEKDYITQDVNALLLPLLWQHCKTKAGKDERKNSIVEKLNSIARRDNKTRLVSTSSHTFRHKWNEMMATTDPSEKLHFHLHREAIVRVDYGAFIQ